MHTRRVKENAGRDKILPGYRSGQSMNQKSVDQWRRGQAAASQKIEEERTGRIVDLTPRKSIRIYLSLQPDRRSHPIRREPSPVLLEMRKALGLRANNNARRQ